MIVANCGYERSGNEVQVRLSRRFHGRFTGQPGSRTERVCREHMLDPCGKQAMATAMLHDDVRRIGKLVRKTREARQTPIQLLGNVVDVAVVG